MSARRDSIGGVLDLAALDLLTARPDPAQAHRPTDPEAIAAEVRRLVLSGLTRRDVAAMLRVDLAYVLSVTADICPLSRRAVHAR